MGWNLFAKARAELYRSLPPSAREPEVTGWNPSRNHPVDKAKNLPASGEHLCFFVCFFLSVVILVSTK